MNRSLLPVGVRAKEEKGYDGWSGGEGRFLYEGAFYVLRWGLGFSKFVDCRGREKR